MRAFTVSVLIALAAGALCACTRAGTPASGAHPNTFKPSGVFAAVNPPAMGASPVRTALAPIPASKAAYWLTSVSCAAPRDCWAVGLSSQPGTNRQAPIAAHWTGARWQVSTLSLPLDSANGALLGISCTRANCVAVGHYYVRDRDYALAEYWNGRTWRPGKTGGSGDLPRNPANSPGTVLQGISCPAPRSCAAIGFSQGRGDGVTYGVIESWDGTAWSLPDVVNREGMFTAISCASSASCLAVGTVSLSGGRAYPRAEKSDGSAWQDYTPPAFAGTGKQYPTGISCTGVTMCTVAGAAADRDGSQDVTRPFSQTWDSGRWTPASLPPGPRAPGNLALYGVSCASTAHCVAVGAAGPGAPLFSANGDRAPVAFAGNGSRWASMPLPPLPKGTGGKLSSVSCPSVTECVAVGVSGPVGSGTQTRILTGTWDGRSWRLTTLG